MNGQNLQDFLLNNSSLTSKITWQKRVSIQSVILLPRVPYWLINKKKKTFVPEVKYKKTAQNKIR